MYLLVRVLKHFRSLNCKWCQLSTADIDSLKRMRNKTKYCYILHTMNCFLFGIYYFINIAYTHMNSEQFSELFHHAAHLFCHSVHLRIIGLRWNAIYGRLRLCSLLNYADFFLLVHVTHGEYLVRFKVMWGHKLNTLQTHRVLKLTSNYSSFSVDEFEVHKILEYWRIQEIK